MKFNKILAAILALTILVGCFALPVGAASVSAVEGYANNPKAEDKIATMESVFKNDSYELFYQSYTGEIAIKNLATGEYFFSNPCDLEVIDPTDYDASQGEHTKTAALLSQIIVRYTDKNTDTSKYLGSFDSAAVLGNQIEMMRIDDGIRVEYALGSVESKRLVPMWIEKSRFEEKIYEVIRKAAGGDDKEVGSYGVVVNQLKNVYYREINYNTASEADKQLYLKQYPILQTNPDLVFYVLADTGALSLAKIEELVKTKCPEYTFDELEADHTTTGYDGDSIEPPLFRLAIEYTFNKDGFSATVPAKSIRYNETNYSLDEIVILPYFGCTTTTEIASADANVTKKTTDGYLFLPDGSGTLLEYYNKDGSVKTGVQNISVYGVDYAYENLESATTTANSKLCRIPVFGLTDYYDITTQTVRSGLDNFVSTQEYKQGFVAVITAGESLAKITASLGQLLWNGLSASMSQYNTVYAAFSMQQTDTVSLGSALGGGSSMSQSVDTRYIGDYSVQYMLLAKDKATYSGMAEAYRNYLVNTGAISALGTADTTLPLYIQTLGAMKVSDEFLTFPVTVTRALTSFENVKDMTNKLASAEYPITNVKYILSGYVNGTASSNKYPTSVKFNSTVGGKKGFIDLVKYAEENNIEVMPNFDFANVRRTNWGFSMKKHAALMMSDRYATKRSYDAVYQSITRRGFANIVSTTAYNHIFEKFSASYDKFFTEIDGYNGSLAALTLGTDLNSDFNRENPITREDSKQNTVKFLNKLSQKYDSVVVEGGNAYSIPYADAILSIPLDNSNYAISSASIPFMGMVLHGHKNYAGDPLNMSGDVQYAILKSIENGAAPYYFLVYSHATDLRTSKDLSDYYSADFNSWFAKPTDSSVKDTSIQTTYKTINDAIGTLQNATITDHKFYTAFKLDANEAAVLFNEYNNAYDALYSTDVNNLGAIAKYEAAAKNTEKNKYSGDLATYISAERDAKNAYVAAQTKLANVEALITRNDVGGVVSVTYTDGATSKTFYINYNNFEVTFETEKGKVYTIAPMAFVTAEDVAAGNQAFTVNKAKDAATAYLATTAKIVGDFTSANESLIKAVEKNSEYEINRAITAINVAVEDVAKASNGEVVTIDYANDSVIYVNYTSGNVIVKISDTRYELIPAQSYLIIE